ncbi:hypothetical protein RP20_CCG009453 [Aedes albopictus]|nr:hypothetical protein RP20_CCG009453 [Aedes albopictus]
MEFSTPPLPVIPALPTNNGTLRRGTRAMVPPPDVTHHTQHTVKTLHDSSASSGLLTAEHLPSQQQHQHQQSGLPPSGLNHLNSIGGGLQMLGVQNPSPVPMMGGGPPPGLVPVSGAGGGSSLGNNLLIGAYDPSSTNLSSFNASLGYTDADGHLV